MEDIYKSRIKPLFDSTGLTMKQIAIMTGIPVKKIYDWNNGIGSYDKYFNEIAKAFHVSVAYLKGETDDPSPEGDGLSPARAALLDAVDGMSEDEIFHLIKVIAVIKNK